MSAAAVNALRSTTLTIGGEDEAIEALQFHCVRELQSLRRQLQDSHEENALLRRKIQTLTEHLTETTQELAQRMELYNEATERAEQAETRSKESDKAILTREMQIHDLSQQVTKLTLTLQKEEQARGHWERQYIAAKDEVAKVALRAAQAKEDKANKAAEAATWKAKIQTTVKAMHGMTQEIEGFRSREKQLVLQVSKHKEALADADRKWKAKVDKRDKAIVALQSRLQQVQAEQEHIQEKAREMMEKEAQWRSCEATQHLEKRRQLLDFQQELDRIRAQLETAKMNELLLQRELCRLREELLLSESRCKTERRRHEQALRGKDKEMAFIWQRYIEAVASRGGAGHHLELPLPHR